MESRKGFLTELTGGISKLNSQHKEKEAVEEYRNTSELFIKLQHVCLNLEEGNLARSVIKSMEEAETFQGLIDCLKPYDTKSANMFQKTLIQAAFMFGKYVSYDALAADCLSKMKDDIQLFAIKKGFFKQLFEHKIENKEAPTSPKLG